MSAARRTAGDLARASLARDDAAELARRGFVVTAFDVAPTAVAWCRRRFPGGRVRWQVADVLAPRDEGLVIARGRDPGDPEGAMPWPLLHYRRT